MQGGGITFLLTKDTRRKKWGAEPPSKWDPADSEVCVGLIATDDTALHRRDGRQSGPVAPRVWTVVPGRWILPPLGHVT